MMQSRNAHVFRGHGFPPGVFGPPLIRPSGDRRHSSGIRSPPGQQRRPRPLFPLRTHRQQWDLLPGHLRRRLGLLRGRASVFRRGSRSFTLLRVVQFFGLSHKSLVLLKISFRVPVFHGDVP